MFYVYVTKSAPDPVKFETMAEACSFVTSQDQPTETRLFTEETHAKFLVKRERKSRHTRIRQLMQENRCSRVWAYKLYRRENGGQPLEPRRRGPKLSAQRLREKIQEHECLAGEYRRQLAELEPVDITSPVIDETSQRVEPGANMPGVIVGICREDNPADVDEAYGAGTYARVFPDAGEKA